MVQQDVSGSNVAVSGVVDLGASFASFGWYYDFTTTMFNGVTGSFYAKSASDSGSLVGASWFLVATNYYIPPTEINRYHQFKVVVDAFNAYDFTVHQVSIKSLPGHGYVEGVVQASGSLDPTGGARVRATESGSLGSITVRSNASGSYKLTSLAPATYLITASHSMYNSQTRTLTLGPGEGVSSFDFLLGPLVPPP